MCDEPEDPLASSLGDLVEDEEFDRERFGKALAETKGSLPKDAYPEWATPEKTSAWVRALRAVDNEATNRKLARLE